MKEISLKMNENFKIEVLSFNKLYELENNSTLLNIECDVDEEMAYKLHIEHKADKSLLLMDKGENGISKLLTSSYITENGSYYLQVEGIKEDYRIISNTIKLEVGGFINAEYIPTPEEESIIDNVLIKVGTMDDKVVELNGRIDEMYARADSGEFNGKDGKDGKDGVNGKDGYTPVKGVDYFDGAKGDKGDTGANGKDGINGTNGKDGSDGFSPSAKAERVDDGVEITITDKDGTTSAKVYDGKGGGGDVTKAYVDAQDAKLQEQLDDELAEIHQLNETVVDVKADLSLLDNRVTTLENTPIPESAVQTAVDNYVETHSAGFATQEELEIVPYLLNFKRTTQEFNYFKAQNNKAISSSTGAISDNNNFWLSDKIYINGNSNFISNRGIYKVVFYNADGSLNSVASDTKRGTVYNIPSGAFYLICQLSKGAFPYEDRASFVFSFGIDLSPSTIFYESVENAKKPYSYYGEKVVISDNTFDFVDMRIDMSASNMTAQGLVAYNDVAYQFYNTGGFRTIDLKTNARSQMIYYDTINKPHANCVFLGSEKYNESDLLPLVYVNAYNNPDLPKGTLFCYRIDSSMSSTLMQTISIGFVDDEIWSQSGDTRPYGNFIMDEDNNHLIAYTLRDADRKTRFFVFNMPSVDDGDITLNQSDIIDYFDLEYFEYIQDAFYKNGKLYLLHGSEYGNKELIVVNLTFQKISSKIDLSKIKNEEPEGLTIYKDTMYYSCVTNFYKLIL